MPSLPSLPAGYRALVVGAGGAIGSALLRALRADPRCAAAIGLGRRGGDAGLPAFDLEDPASIEAAATAARALGPFHLVLIATGTLQPGGRPPEKRLADLDAATLARAFAINATGPALLLRHLHEALPLKERALVAVLSARVGSIGDNRKGGWYAYRAAKAALNMLLKTTAIEVARRRPLAVLVALHPGTVQSALSAPFAGDAETTDPDTAAQNLLRVLNALPAEGASGSFLAWDGQPVPW